MLIDGRKFDLRVFVLFTVAKGGAVECRMHTEFYVRTSSVAYSTRAKDVADEKMHLTNDAVQNKGAKKKGGKEGGKEGGYGRYEDANKLSMEDLGAIMEEHEGVEKGYVEEVLVPRLREMVSREGFAGSVERGSVESNLLREGEEESLVVLLFFFFSYLSARTSVSPFCFSFLFSCLFGADTLLPSFLPPFLPPSRIFLSIRSFILFRSRQQPPRSAPSSIPPPASAASSSSATTSCSTPPSIPG